MCIHGRTVVKNFAMKNQHERKQKRMRNNEKLVKWRNFNTKSHETANRAWANEKTSCTLWTMLRASSDLAADAFDPNTCRLYSDLPAFIATPLGNGVDSFYAQLLFVCLLSISIAFIALCCFCSEWVARIWYIRANRLHSMLLEVYNNKNNVSHSKYIVDFNFHVCFLLFAPLPYSQYVSYRKEGGGELLLKVEFNRKLWLKMLLVSAQTHTHVASFCFFFNSTI